MAKKNSKIITRSARRIVTPAITPGSLENPVDGKTMFGQNFLRRFWESINHYANQELPEFSANTRRLDLHLQQALSTEKTGFLSAFVDQASMINSNLHYRIVGAKSLVNRTLELLHASEGGEGFRRLIKLTALNFYSSNFGGAVYLDRSSPVTATYLPDQNKWWWSTPPVQAMFATDPTLFDPNRDYIYPVSYDGELWNRYDYFRVVSMPSTVLRTWGIGRCPLYRCIQIAKMTSATYEHIYNTLSPDTAKGIVTIKGMSIDEFLEAINGSEAVNEEDASYRKGFLPGDLNGEIVVLADREEDITVKYQTLSRLPDGFFIDQWIRWTLTSFATNLGFPLDEFIGMPANRLLGSSGAEVTQNANRATTKGGADFKNDFQDRLQALVIPDNVSFTFGERDESYEASQVELASKKIETIVKLFEATQIGLINQADEFSNTLLESRAKGQHIISRDEARLILDAWDTLPMKLTNTTTADVSIDDNAFDLSQQRLKIMRDRVRDLPQIKRLATSGQQGEPVIQHDNFIDPATGFVRERETVLWEDVSELGKKSVWTGVDLSGGTYNSAGPIDYKRRVANKPITLEQVLSSDHVTDLARIIRRNLLNAVEYLQHEELTETGLQKMEDRVSKKDHDALVSRLYAIVQLGRDSSLGRKSVSDIVAAHLASNGLKYAQERVPHLFGSIDRRLREFVAATIEANLPQVQATYTLDPRPTIMAALDETIRPWANDLANEEAQFAFEVGQKLVDDFVGVRA